MDIIGLIVLWGGIGFCVVGVVGLVRMPDLYCRLHASGKVSTVGLCGLLLGAALIMPSAALKLVANGDSLALLEIRGDAQLALGQRDQARDTYNKALLKAEVGTAQRRLLELKLTEAGGTPPKTESQS